MKIDRAENTLQFDLCHLLEARWRSIKKCNFKKDFPELWEKQFGKQKAISSRQKKAIPSRHLSSVGRMVSARVASDNSDDDVMSGMPQQYLPHNNVTNAHTIALSSVDRRLQHYQTNAHTIPPASVLSGVDRRLANSEVTYSRAPPLSRSKPIAVPKKKRKSKHRKRHMGMFPVGTHVSIFYSDSAAIPLPNFL